MDKKSLDCKKGSIIDDPQGPKYAIANGLPDTN